MTSIILLIYQVGLLQEIENYVVDFSGNVFNDCLVIISIADFGGENFNGDSKVIDAVYSDDEIRHANLIAKIDYAGKDTIAASGLRDLVSNGEIFVPKRDITINLWFYDQLIALLLVKQGRCDICTSNRVQINIL